MPKNINFLGEDDDNDDNDDKDDNDDNDDKVDDKCLLKK